MENNLKLLMYLSLWLWLI